MNAAANVDDGTMIKTRQALPPVCDMGMEGRDLDKN
jgi:hypothetical protein